MNWQDVLAQLETGALRAANQDENGHWHANVEVKQGILAAFKAGKNVSFHVETSIWLTAKQAHLCTLLFK